MVGWARVRFKFPTGVNPCIGVKEPKFPKLSFVRNGECWIGVYSVRRALEKRAQIDVLDGWGFRPTDKESNHNIHAAKTTYTTLREHRVNKDPIARYKIKGVRPKYEWDWKRKLTGPSLSGPDLWTQHRETEP